MKLTLLTVLCLCAIIPAAAQTLAPLRTQEVLLYSTPSAHSNTASLSVRLHAPECKEYTLTLPTSAGEAGQFLSTDGNGTLVWRTVNCNDALKETVTTLQQQNNDLKAANADLVKKMELLEARLKSVEEALCQQAKPQRRQR